MILEKLKKFSIFILISCVSSITYATSFKISAWNIQHGKYPDKIERELETQVLGESDIICWQEMKSKSKLAQKLSKKYGYFYHSVGSDVIFSKYPFVEVGKVFVQHEDRGRTAAWATIDIEGTHVRVYSIHLAFKTSGLPFISKTRGRQMQKILDHANQFNGPTIQAGDLNTIGFILGGQSREHAIKKLKRDGYEDAFKKFPYMNTQRAGHFLRMGRIDWIWYRDAELKKSIPGRFAKSDHKWLFSEFEI